MPASPPRRPVAGGGGSRRSSSRLPPRSRGRAAIRPPTPDWWRAGGAPARADRASSGSSACCARSRCRLVEVLAAMERAGVKLDAKRLAEIGEGMAERIDELEREIYELAGHEFTIGSPQQLGTVLFSRARTDQEAPRQDRLLDRCPGAGADPRRARDHRQGGELARAHQAEEHLPRRPARAGRSGNRAHPHHLQPGRRAPPDGSRASTRTCRTSRSARRSGARSAAASSPRRACGSCRPTTTRSSSASSPMSPARRSCGRSSPPARTSTARPPRRSWRFPGGGRPRRALEGEDGQLRDRLRAVGLRARRPAPDLPRGGGARTSSATSSASRR